MTRRALGWLALNALLWAGVGGAVVRLVAGPPRRIAPEQVAEQATRRLESLGLDASQRAALAQVHDEWRATVLNAEKGFLDQLDQAAAAVDSKIEALLRADQRERYRALSLGMH